MRSGPTSAFTGDATGSAPLVCCKQKILGWVQTGLHQSFCRRRTAYHCLHEGCPFGLQYLLQEQNSKTLAEVKTYSPAEPLKAGQCPCWAVAELVGKRTADKLYNLLPNESLWTQILAGNPFKPLHFLKWKKIGPEIYFYVSSKHGLHESRSISGYWLRTGVHGRDMLSSGAVCIERIHRATTALLSHSNAGHILEISMLHTLTSAMQCHTAVLHRPQPPILLQNLSPPASPKSLPVEEAVQFQFSEQKQLLLQWGCLVSLQFSCLSSWHACL